jgi:hypothetical protein
MSLAHGQASACRTYHLGKGWQACDFCPPWVVRGWALEPDCQETMGELGGKLRHSGPKSWDEDCEARIDFFYPHNSLILDKAERVEDS